MSLIKNVTHRSNGKHKIILVNYKKIFTKNIKPYKPLTKGISKTGGRNNSGKITVRHIGGGHKKKYRIIDFKRNKLEIPGIVKTIEYDPNRTAFISLIFYKDGEKRYILAPDKLKVGTEIISSDNMVDIKPGNSTLIKNIPDGTIIHNIELTPGKGGIIARSSGTWAQILGRDLSGKFTIVKFLSKENRKIPNECRATIGQVSNPDHNLVMLGKAGKSRYLGIRPTVRGSAMNPNDHTHGGGEGRCPIGRDAPRTPWGKKHMGIRTRKKNKYSSSLIIKSRHMSKLK